MESKIMNILEEIDKELLNVEKDENIFSLGLIDSLDIFNIITRLEEEFEIEIDGDDIVEENFSSISRIISFMQKKVG